MPAPLLLADDDPSLREVVRVALELQGFSVVEASDGRQALQQARALQPRLVLLDINMPELDGLSVCRELRTFSRVPVVFLSSRDEELDRVLGLELGGDDYLTKPFSPRELVARVKAVLRRTEALPADEADRRPAQVLQRGRLTVDLDDFVVTWDGARVVLTVMELTLLATLLRAPTRAFTRDELIERAYDGVVVSDRTVDSHIRRIRQKLSPQVVETVHGHGYRLGQT